MHFFTSITTNYLPKARILAKSLREHCCEDVFFTLVLSDNMPEYVNINEEPFDEIWYINDLNIPVNNLDIWIFKHNIVELCTAVKGPAILRLLQESKFNKIVYLDPDIAVFGDMKELSDRLDQYEIVLTPHLCEPENTAQDIENNEITALRHGIYNLGFIGLRRGKNSMAFAKWWRDRLLDYCFDDIPNGLFTDQRWCDFVPAFFEGVYIERSPAYNVCTWNLSKRTVTTENGIYRVNGVPMQFYHFSGFDSGAQEGMLKLYGNNKVTWELRNWYIEKLKENGQIDLGGISCKYSFFTNHEKILPLQRYLLRTRPDLIDFLGDRSPFDYEGDLSFWSWYNRYGKHENDMLSEKDIQIRQLEQRIAVYRKYLSPLIFLRDIFHRCRQLLEKKNKIRLKYHVVVISISHSDYLNSNAGVERYIKAQETGFLKRRVSYLHVYPAQQNMFGINIDGVSAGLFSFNSVRDMFNSMKNKKILSIQIHHALHLNLTDLLKIIENIRINVYYYIHDFYAVCPQVHLMKNNLFYCQVGKELFPCYDCQFGANIIQHREAWRSFFKKIKPIIVAPSDTAKNIFINIFHDICCDIKVVPHLLFEGKYEKSSLNDKIRIAFIGHTVYHKGYHNFRNIADRFSDIYEFYSFGQISDHPLVRSIPVSIYDSKNMTEYLREYNIDIAFLYSLCPETYSYTYFESYCAGCFVITGQNSGNIAAQVQEKGNGKIFETMDEIILYFCNTERVKKDLISAQKLQYPYKAVKNDFIVETLENITR